MAEAYKYHGGVVTLDLTKEESEFLRAVLNKVAGDPKKLRGHADQIGEALAEAGVNRRRLTHPCSLIFQNHRGVFAETYETESPVDSGPEPFEWW